MREIDRTAHASARSNDPGRGDNAPRGAGDGGPRVDAQTRSSTSARGRSAWPSGRHRHRSRSPSGRLHAHLARSGARGRRAPPEADGERHHDPCGDRREAWGAHRRSGPSDAREAPRRPPRGGARAAGGHHHRDGHPGGLRGILRRKGGTGSCPTATRSYGRSAPSGAGSPNGVGTSTAFRFPTSTIHGRTRAPGTDHRDSPDLGRMAREEGDAP